MSKTVVIHQPDFLPYLGFFHRLLIADTFVVFDTAQFVDGTSQSWMHRDKIKTPQGEKWLSLSIKKAPRNTPISEIQLSDAVDWRTANLNLLRANYRMAPYFREIFPHLEQLYAFKGESMMHFNLKSIELLLTLFDIKIPLIFASSLDVQGSKNELLVDILKKAGASHYLSGIGARAYFDPAPFKEAGIEVVWQDFTHPVYPQLHGEFIPYLSSIDLLFNCGIEKSREILKGSK
ncbi:MAG TPA: WbqC family protein [Sideroxyarcus sp.]|nr:WbqC family protein [Sideroxyarcus sp.]